MEKVINNNEKEIIENIMNTILKYYPKKEREEIIFKPIQSQMDIAIQFININNKDYTSIIFSKGSINVRSGFDVNESFLINGLIPPNTINELIFNILEDYDYFRNLFLTENEISTEFALDMKYGCRYGIGCNRIGLSLDFWACSNKEELVDTYFTEIAKIYRQEIESSFGVINEIKLRLKEIH